jgi:hypothetical protein
MGEATQATRVMTLAMNAPSRDIAAAATARSTARTWGRAARAMKRARAVNAVTQHCYKFRQQGIFERSFRPETARLRFQF